LIAIYGLNDVRAIVRDRRRAFVGSQSLRQLELDEWKLELDE